MIGKENCLRGGSIPGMIRRLGAGERIGSRESVIRHLSKAGGHTSNTPMNRFRLSIFIILLAIFAVSGVLAWSAPPAGKGTGVLRSTMQAELDRPKTSLAKSDPAPYLISYEVYDQCHLVDAGTYG